MKIKMLVASVASALAMICAPASASYVDVFQGVTFTFDQIDGDSFKLRIQGAQSATGDWADAQYLDNLAFKDLGSSFTGGSGSPGTWTFSVNELNNNGCAGGDSGGVCFDANSPIALTDDMTFTFDLVGGTLDINQLLGPHLKVRFLDGTFDKEGSLLSHNLTFTNGGEPNPQGELPEPASLALFGIAALGAGWASRKKSVQFH